MEALAMHNVNQARFINLSLISRASCLLMFFSPLASKSQSNSSGVDCKPVYECPYEYIYEYVTDPVTGQLKYTLNYRPVCKYVTKCVPAPVEPSPAETSTNAPRGEIRKIWVDHSVYDNQQKGMRIHLTFKAQNLKDKKCRANVYFYFASGKPLKDFNDKYNTPNGNVATHAD